MNATRSQIFIGIFAAFITVSSEAEIYRSLDANGNPVFSDKPINDSISVELKETNTTPAVTPQERQAATKPHSQAAQPATTVSITSPSDGQVFANGRIGVTLSASTDRPLSQDQRIRFLHNGKELQSSRKTSIRIAFLARGQHQFSAELLDANGAVLHQDTTSATAYWPQN